MLNLNAISKKFAEKRRDFYFQIFQITQNASNEFDFILNKIIDIMKKNIKAFFHVDYYTATFLQRVNRRNRIYQLKYLKRFLKTVSRNVKNK